MTTTSVTHRLQYLLQHVPNKIAQVSEVDMSHKPTPQGWSKKEMLGHLVDAALHNLRRFVAAHYMEMPFAITAYEKEALVIANHYQELPTTHILQLWQSINKHIVEVVSRLSAKQLAEEVINPDEFKFLSVEQLLQEYIDHTEQCLKQILQ